MKRSRRSFVKLAGVAGGLALGAGPAAARNSDDSQRFLIDLREVSRSSIPEDMEIVHDLSAIDVLVAVGDAGRVGGEAATVPDIELARSGSGRGGALLGDVEERDEDDERGPARERDENDEDDEAGDEEADRPDRRRLQWDKRAQALEEIHETTTGAGARVGIIDTGVYADHPDLDGVVNRELSRGFTGDGEGYFLAEAEDHGTHVAGIVAATDEYDHDDRGGVRGTAPEAELLGLRVFGATGGAYAGDVAAATMYAADEGCDAVNISIVYPLPYVDPDEYPWMRRVREIYERAVAYGREREMIVVNSAGNSAIDLDPPDTVGLPAEAEDIFAVSATGPIGFLWDDGPSAGEMEEADAEGEEEEDEDGDDEEGFPPLRKPTTQPAIYTSYGGSVVDVSAAGGNYSLDAVDEANDGDANDPNWFYDMVLSTVFAETDGTATASYGFKAGTSMAAPQVAGAVALARSLRPEMGVGAVEDAIRNTANDVGQPDYHGNGHLDLSALVERLGETDDEDEAEDEADESEDD